MDRERDVRGASSSKAIVSALRDASCSANAASWWRDDCASLKTIDSSEAQSPATVVTLYVLPEMMMSLRPKLLSELRAGTRIVSHDYHFREWVADARVTFDGQPFITCPGQATRRVLPGQHQVVASKQGFVTETTDLVLVPGTPWVLSSGMAEGAGFYVVDSRTGESSALPFAAAPDASFARCATPPAPATLNTHGLNIRAQGPARARLHVVGHGAREAIEIFDVDATGARPTLTWKGCVPMPEGLAANSVASFADGSLVATVLFMPGKTFAEAVVERKPTGAVFEWSPGDDGFTLVQGTELPANNGIEVSPDNTEFYVASTPTYRVYAFSRTKPEAGPTRFAQLKDFGPDNLRWTADGKLITAGLIDNEPACGGRPKNEEGIRCPMGYAVASIDPRTMAATEIARGPRTAAFTGTAMADRTRAAAVAGEAARRIVDARLLRKDRIDRRRRGRQGTGPGSPVRRDSERRWRRCFHRDGEGAP